MILLTGGKGMLGGYFQGPGYLRTDIDSLDITRREDVRQAVLTHKPEAVYHLAAATDVDQCEINPDETYRVNALGTQNVALACQETDTPLVYISTAGVFGGDKCDPYTEYDEPNPVNVYGHAKWMGEKIVQQALRRFFIVRAGWMIGGGKEVDKKFVGKLLRLFDEKKKLSVVNDKWGSPIYAKDLAAFIPTLVRTGAYGLYHYANHGVCTRLDIAKELVRLTQADVEIVPVNSAVFPLPAPRARSEAIRNFKLELMGLDHARSWQEALKEYVEAW